MKYLAKGLLIISMPMAIHGCGEEAIAEDALSGPQHAVIHQGSTLANSSTTSKGFRVMTTQEAYRSELLNYSADQPAQVDFSTSQVLLLDAGYRTSGGYSMQIVGLTENSDSIVASIQLTKPGEGCITTAIITNPYEFVEISTRKEIFIQESVVSDSCLLQPLDEKAS